MGDYVSQVEDRCHGVGTYITDGILTEGSSYDQREWKYALYSGISTVRNSKRQSF